MKRVNLIDGNNLFYRYFFGARAKGIEPLPFVVDRFISLKERFKDSRFIFAFDTTKSERRLKLFPGYKQNRKSSLTEEEAKQLMDGLAAFRKITDFSGHTVLEGGGYEADDFIACIANMLKMRHEVVIFSTDMDMLQLITPYIKIYDPIKGITVADHNFENIIEIPLKHFLDFKCMVGDDSDGIPGFEGIGEKTAKKFIQQFGGYYDIVRALKAKQAEGGKMGKRESELINNEVIYTRNKELMDLSLCYSDDKLKMAIKEAVALTDPCRKELHQVMQEAGVGDFFKAVSKLCLKE